MDATTKIRPAVGVAALAIALAGCFAPGGGGAGTPPTTAPGTGDPGPSDPGLGEPGSDPLMLNISVHVEGYAEEDDAGGETVFNAHVAAILGLADDADGGDGVDPGDAKITFELSPIFVNATEVWGSDIISRLDARGHGIGVHADLGGMGYLDRADFTNRLIAMREDIEAQGVDVVHVSGICSPSEWVEAAIDAGFTATTGMVEYCLSSYPGAYPLPCGDTAQECHDPAVTDWEHILHPWRTSTSADWLTADPDGDLLLVSGGAFHDVSVDEFQATIAEYIGHREAGRLNVLSVNWSIGRPPAAGFADDLFAMVAEYVAAGQVGWSTMEEVVAAAG